DAPEPVTLSVYSLYESDNIRTLIREFRKVHPEITVEYKIGYSDGTSLTIDDALKNIATEMAAGTAADILVMDDLPYKSYKEKGALMELTVLREGMTDSEYYTNVLDGFAGEDGFYTMPIAFAVPILAGKSDDIEGMETLEDLADSLEERRRNL
ncbi:MAG: extracellular solute-binding protein, partial [Lachnospiraceae bacterium]|nr:extracellular solute-binding protein [Lachnospiraceae bacterium]